MKYLLFPFSLYAVPGPADEMEDNEDPPSKRSKNTSDQPHPLVRTPIVTFQGHNGPVTGVEWVDEAEIVTAGWDNSLRMWDVHSGENKATLVRTPYYKINFEQIQRIQFYPYMIG